MAFDLSLYTAYSAMHGSVIGIMQLKACPVMLGITEILVTVLVIFFRRFTQNANCKMRCKLVALLCQGNGEI